MWCHTAPLPLLPVAPIHFTHPRHVTVIPPTPAQDTVNAFVQLTVRLRSQQRFHAYDKAGKLVAGDPEADLLVQVSQHV